MSAAAADYASFAARVQATGLLWDPWIDGHSRLQAEPLVLSATAWGAMVQAAEAVAAVHDEAAQLLLREPALLEEYVAPTEAQRAMWLTAAPQWHGIARADVFATAAGPQVCELNSDTPSGEAEAVALSTLAAAARPECRDPNAGLGAAFVAMLAAWARAVGADGACSVGLVYPTEMPEDLSMVALYRRWLEAAGHRVVLGSPFNLGRAADGRAALFDVPCEVVLRHYKTDWWGERLPVRDDEPQFADSAPLLQPLAHLLGAAVDGRTAVVNPFGAIVTQNKRMLALCCEQRQRFSPSAAAAIDRWLPETRRLELVREDLWHDRAGWVLKSDYGCEGDEVVVGCTVEQAEWEDVLSHAIAQRWVAQRFFAASADAGGDIHNHGIYLVGGRAAGVFTRAHQAPGHGHSGVTDATARCVPVLVGKEPSA
jgi:glutathionylspermidine synthase